MNISDAADIISGVVSEGWAPGALNSKDSQKEWKVRAELICKIQSKLVLDLEKHPIEWVSRTYYEPTWTSDDSKRRWRERKVNFQVDLHALKLPVIVLSRMQQLLGTRFNEKHFHEKSAEIQKEKKNRFARLSVDKYETREENRLYALLLFRALLANAWESHGRFVRVNETRAELSAQRAAAVRARVEQQASAPLHTLVSLRY